VNNLALELTESGYVPDSLIRHGIRRLLQQRLKEIHARDITRMAEEQASFIREMDQSPVALLPELANEQHYEVPAEFFRDVLGPMGKYSCCYWDDDTTTLAAAEKLALQKTCSNADIRDGMDILELGCGWGSLTLWMARNYPASNITAVSNSASQRDYIKQRAFESGIENIEVITADMNDFSTERTFDRVVSVEMFEHMRNYRVLFNRVSNWLNADGRFFMHIFVNRSAPYLFENNDNTDWMSRHFFSGGMMPSDDLPLFFQDDLQIEQRWRWDGTHYQKTSEAWLKNLDMQQGRVWPLLENVYGKDFARIWYMRWRMFFLSVAELFGTDDGNEWFVSHYRFAKRTNQG
jgi:cyclopropane-fatty-acyl-phospholipid synthase